MAQRQILLVEDDKTLAQSTAGFLESHQYRVDISYWVADSLERIQGAPDLVLIEHLLPDVKGAEICQRIKGDPRLSHIPIIVLTDHGVSAEELESLYAYGDDHIARPFDNKELLARIEVVLRRTHVSRQAKEEKEIVRRSLRKLSTMNLSSLFF